MRDEKIILMAAIAITLTAGCLKQTEETVTSTSMAATTTLINDAGLLKIAANNSHVSAFTKENAGYNYRAIKLTPENLTILSEKYPAVYGDLPAKTLYSVEYSSGNRGVLVIIDSEEKRVLKHFRTVGVTLS